MQAKKVTFVLFIILWITSPHKIILAQSTNTAIKILEPGPEFKNGLLRVAFTVVDGYGNSLPADVEAAYLSFIEDTTIYPARVIRKPSASNILILIENSASLEVVRSEITREVNDLINELPRNTRFAITLFNEHTQPILDFTADQSQIQAALEGIDHFSGGTCFYNGVFEAIEQVRMADAAILEEASAIVVISSGRDEMTDGQNKPCSYHDMNSVVESAVFHHVPIYALGLQGDNPVNRDVLSTLATATGGTEVSGTFFDLPSLRQQIVTGLTSQWLAEAHFFTTAEGLHTGTVTVQLQDGTEIAQTFQFVSDGIYPRPTGPMDLWITGITLTSGVADVQVEASNPEKADALRLRLIEGSKGGPTAVETIYHAPSETQTLQIKTQELTVDQQYHVEICALDSIGMTVKDANGDLLCAFSANFPLDKEDIIGDLEEEKISMLGRLLIGLRIHLWIPVAALFVCVGTTIWIAMRLQKRKKRVPEWFLNQKPPVNTSDSISDSTESYYPEQDFHVESVQTHPYSCRLVIERTDDKNRLGQTVVINKEHFTVGRNGCDLCLKDMGISRTHAIIVYNGRGYEIKDAGSKNGTVVNGNELGSGEAKLLDIGANNVKLGLKSFLVITIEIAESDQFEEVTIL